MTTPQDFMDAAYMNEDELRGQIAEYVVAMDRAQLETFLDYIREEWWYSEKEGLVTHDDFFNDL